MKILLSDASGLTARQVATILSRRGQTVHVLSPPGITLTKCTSHVSQVHRVPPFGSDPYVWLDATLSIIKNEKKKGDGEGFDVLICTQEQVTILSAEVERVRETGIRIAVPDFMSLRRVMDKVSAREALREAGLRQPDSVVLSSTSELKDLDILPGYAKLPIATGSTGLRRVSNMQELKTVCQSWHAFAEGGKVLLQKEVKGPLLMICGIFSHGRLLTWHACLRVREGVNGGASIKVSCPLPLAEKELETFGRRLGWHGALSIEAIIVERKGQKELYYMDINPRIVEPMNGLLAGVDIVSALVDVSFGREADVDGERPKHGREGMTTHQLMLALLGTAKNGRIELVKEVWMAVRGLEGYYGYKGSVEELTPIEGDWWSVLVLLVMTVLLFVGGKWMVSKFTGGTIKSYAISPAGWKEICRREDEKGRKKGATA